MAISMSLYSHVDDGYPLHPCVRLDLDGVRHTLGVREPFYQRGMISGGGEGHFNEYARSRSRPRAARAAL